MHIKRVIEEMEEFLKSVPENDPEGPSVTVIAKEVHLHFYLSGPPPAQKTEQDPG